MEEVERVINDLYSNPANVAEANAWLVNFLNSEVTYPDAKNEHSVPGSQDMPV